MTELKKIGMASLGVAGISYGLSWIYKYTQSKVPALANGIATISFSAVDVPVKAQIQKGIDTSIGGKIVGYLSGVIPVGQGVAAFLTLLAAAAVIVWLSGILAERLNVGKTDTSRFAISMAAAAAIVGFGVGSLSASLSGLGIAIALLVYYGIVALIYAWLRTLDGFKDFLPVV